MTMHAKWQDGPAEQSQIEGRLLSGADKIVPLPNWVWFAKKVFPFKTDAHLAAIGGKDARTARRWLAGEFEPPGVVMAALIAKLYERG